MDEVVDHATYGGIMKLAQDLNDGEVENRPAVPLRPTPPPAFRSPPAPAPLTTRVVNRLAPSADGAFVGLSSRDADKDTVRLGAAAVTLAPRRGEEVVRAQMAATEARGEEETRLVRVREEERQAHFAAAAGPREANPAGHSRTRTLPPPALARLVVEQIEGKRRVRLQVLQGPRASNGASPLYASGVVFHLRTSSKLGGNTLLLHKFADQSATIVAGLLAYGAKPQRVHVAFELCSAWRVSLENRVVFKHAMDVVKRFGPDAAIVYCALSRATRSSEEELIAIVDAAAPAHVLVAFPEEDAQLIGDDPDKVRGYLASAIATSAGQAVYAQSWWHGIDALLYNNLNGISRGHYDIPRDIEAQADVLNALLDQCSAPEGTPPVVYVIGRTSPGSNSRRRRKRDEDERRAIAAGTPLPPPDEDKSVTLQLATLRLAVDAATRKRGSAVRVVEVVLQDDGGASRGDLDDLNAVALMRRAKRGDHPGSGGSVVAGAVAGLEIELAANPGWSPDANPGWSPDANPGWSPDANPGWSPDANPGWSPDANPGWSPDANPGWSPDANPGSSPDANPGSSPDANPGSSNPNASSSPPPPSSGSEAPSDAIFLFTRADRLTRSVRLMREIATLASITTDPATGERLARVRVMTVEIESTSSLLAGDSVGPDAAVASTSRPDAAVASTSRPDPDPPSRPDPDAVAARLCGGALTRVPPALARETRVALALARLRGSSVTTLLPLPCVLGADNVDAFLTGTHEGFLLTYGDFRHVSGRDVETREAFPSSGGGGVGAGAVRGASRGFDGDKARFVATRAARAFGLLNGADRGGAAAAAGVSETVLSFYPPRGVSRANDGRALAVERGGRCAFDALPNESAAEARAARPRARQACACDDCRVSVTSPEVTADQRDKVRRDAGERAHAALAELATKLAGGGRRVDGEGVGGRRVDGEGVGGRRVDGLGAAPATAPAHPTDAPALATDPPRPDMFAPDMFAPAESDLSEAQWMLLAAEAETVTLAAVAGFRDAWRNAPRETRSVSALAAARVAVDAACASAPENATTAPEKATTAPASTANRVEALDGPVIRCACRCADASAKCAHAGSDDSTLRTVREGRATRIGKPTYKLPDACWGCHRTFPKTGDGGYGAFCGVSCFDNATRHHRADAIRETEEERVAVGVLVEMERKKAKNQPVDMTGMTSKQKKAVKRKAKANAVDDDAFDAAKIEAERAKAAGTAAREAAREAALRDFGKRALDAACVGFCDFPSCGQMIPLGNIYGLACCNAHKKTK